MRLFEAILDANNRAVAGDTNAGVHPTDFADELPVVALTCIDARLNALLPSALGIRADQFIWLRNAGNIITGPMSSTMRSLALACAVKGGKEIAIIGHTDCQVGQTTTMQLLDRLKAAGVERHLLPENLNEFFGTFGSERQNVIKAAEIARRSPLIGPKVPVHGLLIDVATGRLEWIANGYQQFDTVAGKFEGSLQKADRMLDKLEAIGNTAIGDMKFPETKIGEALDTAKEWLEKAEEAMHRPAATVPTVAASAPKKVVVPPKLPMPPPLKFKIDFRKGKK
jgi:carbonic anhydrase